VDTETYRVDIFDYDGGAALAMGVDPPPDVVMPQPPRRLTNRPEVAVVQVPFLNDAFDTTSFGSTSGCSASGSPASSCGPTKPRSFTGEQSGGKCRCFQHRAQAGVHRPPCRRRAAGRSLTKVTTCRSRLAFHRRRWTPPSAVPRRSRIPELSMNEQQFRKIEFDSGFIAALDQSGGSTPKALELYGVVETAYSDDDEMFALMNEMRRRIVTSPSFNGDRILGAILFENTMDLEIEERRCADYLWSVKHIVPFLKVDRGLAGEIDGAQVMKPMPDLGGLLARATRNGMFGTKMRSLIKLADDRGVRAVVDQQFEVARQILGEGLVPIVEPEVDIHSPQKATAEAMLRTAILEHLDQLGSDHRVILKLTLPDIDDYYTELVRHPRVVRVVALSGGYSRDEANARLARNHGVVASFSRALTESISIDQSDEELDATLDASIATIYSASTT
jgi:fructose-bisphosphate aldolase class I